MLGFGALGDVAVCEIVRPRPSPAPITTVRGHAAGPWTGSTARDEPQACRYSEPLPTDGPHALPWAIVQPRHDGAGVVWSIVVIGDSGRQLPWAIPGRREVAPSAAIWGTTRPAGTGRRLPWGVPDRHERRPLGAIWSITRPADTGSVQPWDVPGRHEHVRLALVYGIARRTDRDGPYPWAYGFPRNGNTTVEIGDGGPPTDGHGTILIPVRRVYFVLSEVFLVRLSDNEPIPCADLTISIDVDSWTHSFSATLGYTAWSLVTGPEPVVVRATVNGYAFDAIIERVDRVRRFGQTQIRASGRGRAAVLAEPYARPATRTNVEARTAQQLAEEALEFTDWELDWQIPDWLVPAGAWSHAGTPIEVITTIARAAGGYVQNDPIIDVLHVLPRYPALPWAWSEETPDVELPLDVLVEESLETVERPAYNAVYVAGVSQGVIGYVKRAGTAGDVVAPLVTDPLTTHVDAARGRGGVILGDTGRQQRLTLTLPVSDDVPLLPPGLLVAVLDGDGYRALTRSLNLRAAWSGNEGLIVRQSVGVERHLIEEA